MNSLLTLWRFAALGSAAIAGFAISLALLRAGGLPRTLNRYTSWLNAEHRGKGALSGGTIVGLQIGMSFAALVLALLGISDWAASGLFVLLVAVTPYLATKSAMKNHVARVEASLATFATALANTLRANPSIGIALARIQGAMPKDLAHELMETHKDIRLGAGVDGALANLSKRVGSTPLDMLIVALLIGRQVGGNVSEVLEINAATLREMSRIHDLIRSKTAEARGQITVLAVLPPLVYLAFDAIRPGYFDPLTATTGGILALTAAIGLWASALVLARGMLRVEF